MKKRKLAIPPRYILLIISFFCMVLLGVNFIFPSALNPVRKGVFEIFIPMQKGINSIGDTVSEKLAAFRHMQEAEEENALLREEIDKLNEKLNRYQVDLEELDDLRELLGLADAYAEYPTTAARVIQKTSGNWFHSFIIDKGSEDGIAVDMNVLSGGGLCGIVTEVGKHYAKVLAIIDDDSNVSAMSSVTHQTFIVAGDLSLYEDGYLNLQYADKSTTLPDGEAVITSNISTKYLPGILIGYAHSVEDDPNHLTRSGYLIPVADFSDLTEVLVITCLKSDLTSDPAEGK